MDNQVSISESLIKGSQEKEAKYIKSNEKIYNSQKIKYRVSPLYQRYVGSFIVTAYNGNFMRVPIGEEVELSLGHFRALEKYIRFLDRQIAIANTQNKYMDDYASGDVRKI